MRSQRLPELVDHGRDNGIPCDDLLDESPHTARECGRLVNGKAKILLPRLATEEHLRWDGSHDLLVNIRRQEVLDDSVRERLVLERRALDGGAHVREDPRRIQQHRQPGDPVVMLFVPQDDVAKQIGAVFHSGLALHHLVHARVQRLHRVRNVRLETLHRRDEMGEVAAQRIALSANVILPGGSQPVENP